MEKNVNKNVDKAQRRFRGAYSGSIHSYVPLSGEASRAKQEFKRDVDINQIIARMKRGINPPQWMTSATPRYGDFTGLPTSFSEAYAIIETAEEAFASLPLEFRRALDHDPRKLDKAPKELFERFGLLKQSSTEGAAPQAPAGLSSGRTGVAGTTPGTGSKTIRKSNSGSNTEVIDSGNDATDA